VNQSKFMNIKNQSLPGSASRSTAAGNLDAFTLIELAVVIATIGLLAVMVLPTLAGTRGRACAANDISNFKQTMTGMTMYCNDNNDIMPAPGFGLSAACWITAANIPAGIMTGHTLANWQSQYAYQIAWFTGVKTAGMIVAPPGSGQLYQYLKNPNILRCPEDMVVNAAYLARGQLISSYVWDGAIVAFGENNFDVTKPFKISLLKPTNILQWENDETLATNPKTGGVWNDFSNFPLEGGTSGYTGTPTFSQRHGKFSQVGRIDGSAGRELYQNMLKWAYSTHGSGPNDLWYNPNNPDGH
jgi:hypothetical protein